MTAGCTKSVQSAPKQVKNNAIQFIDSNGNTVTLPKIAERIVSTDSDSTEMLIAIGAKDKIVGVTDTVAKNPLLMSQLPRNVSNIGNWQNPDVETILTLKPDVVISYSGVSKPKNIDKITAANLTIVYLDCYKMNALASDARALGAITGNTIQAEDYAQFLEKYLNSVKNTTSVLDSGQKPSIYWESYSDYTTVGKGAGGDIMINISGGTNIAGDNATTYPRINSEWIISKDPSYIIKMISPTNMTSGQDLSKLQSSIQKRPGMEKVDAIKNNKVYVMSGSIAFGPRAVVGLLYMAKILHPDQYTGVDPAKVLDEYSQKFLPGSNQGVFLYPIPP